MTEKASSYANLANLAFIEDLYQKYLSNPDSIDGSWRHFFEGMEFAQHMPSAGPEKVQSGDLKVYLLIQAYRMYGHLGAHVDPINVKPDKEPAVLSLNAFGFSESDKDKSFATFGFLPKKEAPLSEIINALKSTYTDHIGIEYVELGNPEMERFIQKRIEPGFPLNLSKEDRLFILHYLNKAELFETFIHTKYVGQKRFSLEGAETLIPMMAAMVNIGSDLEVEEVVIGMAHRGRLNILANILNKSYTQIFHEFEDHYSTLTTEGTGDVKYHKGFQGSLKTSAGKDVNITLSANPSHLESVDPIVEGRARALQELNGNQVRKVLPVLVHGDAAVAGQGVVYETLQLGRIPGYATGGTIHIVVNNQIGFTTLPSESRSTRYCTDIAKAFGCPVLHVNAEDPEMCVCAIRLATELRQKFACDVFIDLNCYRKYGHNEGDEPAFTQPEQYKLIRAKKSIRELFKLQLIEEGVLTKDEAEKQEEDFKSSLHKAIEGVPPAPSAPLADDHYSCKEEVIANVPKVSQEGLKALAGKYCTVPEGFQIHPKIQRLLSDRLNMVSGDPTTKNIDWGAAEHLSFASLLSAGVHIRLSGQDSQRGTFSQRHAVWVNQATSEKYSPLNHLSENQAHFEVLNSPLSEYAVLAFDLGYSLSYPNTLTMWEAQYGDFANTAQVVIDQYISSFEQKWRLHSNLTLLLPHGYEGQGPEHSSARMERYLQLSAQGNLIVANCSTPAQYFHLLRRQAYLEMKKPLIVFTPKALLRFPACVSSLSDLTEGRFEEVLVDDVVKSAQRVIFCSGKVYYDLLQEREKRKLADVAIVRIEQLYPFPKKKIEGILASYPAATQVLWVQEEHSNMGAWDFVRPQIQEILSSKAPLRYVGRPRSAAAAAGSYTIHKKQFQTMMEEAFS